MIRIAIIVGSTRPSRKAEAVARWVYDIASKRSDAEFEVVDILDFNLPLLDEPMSPSRGEYTQPHTKAWSAKIDSFDAFVFVTPEYNRGPSAALKNALDSLYREWNNKAAAFVSYGGASGTRSVEQLRLVMGELQVADVRARVALSLTTDFQNYVTFRPAARHDALVGTMLDQLISWAVALQTVRSGERAHPVDDTTRDEPFKRGIMEQWHDRAIP
jgi:NAD(P)H-dependent FMN reductase